MRLATVVASCWTCALFLNFSPFDASGGAERKENFIDSQTEDVVV
jgi:hypothetical protein